MTHLFLTDTDFSNTDASFCYLLWFQPSLWAMILGKTELTVLLDGRYYSKTQTIDINHIQKILKNSELTLRFVQFQNLEQSIIRELKERPQITVEDNIAVKYVNTIRKNLPQASVSFSSGYLTESRAIKTHQEKQYIRQAIQIIDDTYTYIRDLADNGKLTGKTESYVRGIILEHILKLGGSGESFDSIVAFGPNSAIPHHTSGETIIENGPLLIDMGAKYRGYCSDFTRTFWVGEKTDGYDLFGRIHDTVKQGHQDAFDGYTPEMEASQLDKIARETITSAWYEEYFTHSLGHSLGLDIHEPPRINSSDDTKLTEGMVFTIEPGIYLENQFGVRIEDIVFVEQGKLVKYTNIQL